MNGNATSHDAAGDPPATRSLSDALRVAAHRFAARPAVRCGDRVIDFATFDWKTEALAAGLAEAGVGHGDRVGLLCPNCPEFALAYVAIIKAGAVVVPLNLLLNPREMAFILRDAGVVGLFAHADFSDVANGLSADLPELSLSVHIDGARWNDWLAGRGQGPRIDHDPERDLAAILYTSGTTGQPKGAMLTHRNLLANTDSVRQALGWCAGQDVALVVLPMFHAFAATVGMLTPLTSGCCFIPVPKFAPDPVARAIADGHATIFLGVPSMFSLLLKLDDASVPLLRSLRFCVSGGAALPVEVLTRFVGRFGVPVHEGDGPTECSPVTCVNPIGGIVKPGTVGPPIPGVEMRIVDEAGAELPDGEVGEIAVRGASVFKGYWGQPEATAEVFRADWFLTGDLGTRDADGYFSIVDRKKDLIIVNGMNVYPRVIEEVLYRYPPIREAAVVGEPHPLHGEIPVAFVALHEPDSVTPAAIRAWCREHLGRHEVPRVVTLVPQLPRNAAGKILKRELRRHGEYERGVVPEPP